MTYEITVYGMYYDFNEDEIIEVHASDEAFSAFEAGLVALRLINQYENDSAIGNVSKVTIKEV